MKARYLRYQTGDLSIHSDTNTDRNSLNVEDDQDSVTSERVSEGNEYVRHSDSGDLRRSSFPKYDKQVDSCKLYRKILLKYNVRKHIEKHEKDINYYQWSNTY